ncbi:hypothetical protein HanOQP8_Chr14g0511001 [Helianthus annuus]|nr:hypothetical protein HanOQP8_Chr14g0511001 [Helianthus annuus]
MMNRRGVWKLAGFVLIFGLKALCFGFIKRIASSSSLASSTRNPTELKTETSLTDSVEGL